MFAKPAYPYGMTSPEREYEPSGWERGLAAATVVLIGIGILCIAASLGASALQWTGSVWPAVAIGAFASLPLALVCLLAVVAIGIARRRRS